MNPRPPSPTHAPLVTCTGIATIDTVYGVDVLPSGDGKWSATWLEETGGGVAANAAVAIARLGGRSRFAGCVGDDHRGALLRDGLGAESVAISTVQTISDRPTPTSAVMIDAVGRRMIVNHLADDFFALAEPEPAGDIGDASAVLVDVRWVAGARRTIDAANRRGIPSVVDVDRPIPEAVELLDLATHLVFSNDALTGLAGTDSPRAAITEMGRRVDAWIAVTLGEEGVLWLADDGSIGHLEALEIEAVDTLGAGDTFHGAFALALAEGRGELDALRFANVAAALKCATRGGRIGMPGRDAVEQVLNDAG